MIGSRHTLVEDADTAPGAGLECWAAALALDRPHSHVVRLPGSAPDPEPILTRGDDGGLCGRGYAGELALDGMRLRLVPQMGLPVLRQWVRAAVDMRGVDAWSDDDDVAPLLGLIWVSAVDGASRHGPPAFRREVPYVGSTVRGHLDVRRTVRLRARGETAIASVYRGRDLDNPVTRAIVAADRVLLRQIGHTLWRTDRLDDILPQLRSAVGRRVALPGDRELGRVRYSPITRPFKWAAELSARIVRQDPIATTARPGRVQGTVIDVADVRRHAAIEWARATRPDLRFQIDGEDVVVVAPSGRRERLETGRLPTDTLAAAAAVRETVAAL